MTMMAVNLAQPHKAMTTMMMAVSQVLRHRVMMMTTAMLQLQQEMEMIRPQVRPRQVTMMTEMLQFRQAMAIRLQVQHQQAMMEMHQLRQVTMAQPLLQDQLRQVMRVAHLSLRVMTELRYQWMALL
jgi:hypothetical protein